jgi:hypothetical protein
VNIHQFRRESFANTLKDAVSHVFGWNRELLEGRTKQAREWRDQIDPWWAERLKLPKLTPRWVLQYWGTDVCRRAFHDDIWIAALEARLSRRSDNTVISDVRFPNEIASIRSAGGKIVWVKRGPLPEWYDLAVESNTGTFNHMKTAYPDIHVSETAWVGTQFDYEIDNNGTIDELYTNIKNLVLVAPPARAID